MAQKILVIDDDRTNVRIVQSALQQKSYEVEIALDGDIGLEKVNQFKPDLIVLDIQMPRMNGYTFMFELKKLKVAQSIPIIVLTAHNEWEAIFRYKGVKDYMVKPIKIEELLIKINKCLSLIPSENKSKPDNKTQEKGEEFH